MYIEKLQGLLNIKSPPKYLLCPITHELLIDPVLTADGHTYERKYIEAWLLNHNTSPITGSFLPEKSLRPNLALKSALQEYKDVLISLNIKPTPLLISNPLRDLYKTAYGHQFGVPFADITNEKLSSLKQKSEMALNGNINIKYC
jgi:U-box domain